MNVERRTRGAVVGQWVPEKMRRAGMPDLATEGFLRALRFVAEGGETRIPVSSIDPVGDLESLCTLAAYEAAGRRAMSQAVVIKLNGGLGTSMGLSKAKSLLEVRPGMTFLDLLARQVLAQREQWSSPIPFLLMNSYRTRGDSLEKMSDYPDLTTDLSLDFVQHKV